MSDRFPSPDSECVQSGRRFKADPGRRTASARNFGLIGSAAMLAAGGSAGILGAALLATPSGATGTTWVVDSLGDGDANASHCAAPTNGACTLRDALAAEQTGDTITFDASLSGGTIDLTASEGQLEVDHRGVTITGPGSGSLTVNQTVSGNPVFYLVAYNDNVVMSGLKVTGGTKSGIAGYGVTDLTLNDMEITGNSSSNRGGGLYLDNFYGDLTLTNSYIHNNTATNEGGGIFVPATASNVSGPGSVHISSTVISNNTSGGSGGGGFLSNSESVTIEDSTFSGNDSGGAGGALNISASPTSVTITGSTFDGNTAVDEGGAIGSRTPELTISNSTFTANTGKGGGGLSVLSGSLLTINQSTFAGNTAVSNKFFYGGGGILLHNMSGLTAILSGTIVSGNTSAVSGKADIASYSSLSVTVNSANSLIGEIDPYCTLSGSGNLRSNTPLLGALANNGGPTRTMALLTGSPAIDAGPDPVATFVGNEYDQRGVGFPRVTSGLVDIGAFEFEPEPEPTTTTTSVNPTTTTTSVNPTTTTTSVNPVVPQFTG